MIKPYSFEWSEKYRKEAELIRQTLGDLIIEIQHIGSTAIPGLSAKPIIDIAILTKSIFNIDIFTEALEKIGYDYNPNMSSAERIFLRKGNPTEYHLSISESKYTYWTRQILFRDYLRNHPEAVKEYQGIKENAIKGLPEEDFKDLSRSKEYNTKKGPFVEKILQLAQKEFNG